MHKRTAIVTIMFILLFVVLVTGYYFLNVQKAHEKFTLGQNLTEEQKQEAISIALKDSKVKSEIGNNKYNITGVEVLGIGTESSNITYYPTVMIRLGDDPSFGRGIFAYVDLYNRTVADIGNPYYGPIPVKNSTT